MNVKSIGRIAAELLEQSQTAVVQGITRQGVFLHLDSGWVIFLSREVERGPLTANIEDNSIQLHDLVIGSRAHFAPQGIFFDPPVIASQSPERSEGAAKQSPPKTETASSSEVGSPHKAILLLETNQAQEWSAPPRPSDYLPAAEREFAVASTIRQAQNLRITPSLVALQAVLDGANHAPDGEAGHFYPHLARINALLASRQRSAVTAITSPLRQLDPHGLSALLGLGSGLTPSGDDILLGMLLALNRWRQLLAPRLDVATLNRNIVPQAYQRTTTISANLIECASRGQADERLITALDGLMTGMPAPAEAARLLAEWGSSSGLDTLCGMALVI